MHMPNIDKCHPFILEMSGNEILTQVKGHKSFKNLSKLTHNNPNPDLVNINACAKYCHLPPIVLKISSGNKIK